MIFPESAWLKYINMLSAINNTAAKKFTAYLNTHDVSTALGRKSAIDYAYALATQYGETAAAAACEMYDAVAEASGVALAAAEPAATAAYGEVAKAVNGLIKQNMSNEAIGESIGRLVKRAGADTTLKNVKRDGAEFAWIPHGDTCSFCLMLASNGWQKASNKTIKGDHAEHIHSNCDCTFAIRFDGASSVEGYDPDKYREMYDNAEGRTWQEKLNSMRREQYAENADKIREQKRIAYDRRSEYNKGKPTRKEIAERIEQAANIPNNNGFIARNVADNTYSLDIRHQKYLQHIDGTTQYQNAVNSRGRPQSCLTISEEEAQSIIYKNYGLGTVKTNGAGESLPAEYVTLNDVVGYYYERGERIPTKRIMILYSKSGAHIVPVKEK